MVLRTNLSARIDRFILRASRRAPAIFPPLDLSAAAIANGLQMAVLTYDGGENRSVHIQMAKWIHDKRRYAPEDVNRP